MSDRSRNTEETKESRHDPWIISSVRYSAQWNRSVRLWRQCIRVTVHTCVHADVVRTHKSNSPYTNSTFTRLSVQPQSSTLDVPCLIHLPLHSLAHTTHSPFYLDSLKSYDNGLYRRDKNLHSYGGRKTPGRLSMTKRKQ